MKSQKIIWILEDDPGCLFVYKEILDIRYHTRYFDTFKGFQKEFSARKEERPDFMIVDLSLKDGCFLNFISTMREKLILQIPFIIVSSLSDIDALRFCFEEGALDYLIKPFRKNELIVKLERMLAQPQTEYPKKENYQVPEPKQLSELDLPFLTRKEFCLFREFYQVKGTPIQRDHLLYAGWRNTKVHPKTLDVHLYNLRKKILHLGLIIISHEQGSWVMLDDGVSGENIGN